MKKKNIFLLILISLTILILLIFNNFYQLDFLSKKESIAISTGLLDKQKQTDQIIIDALKNNNFTINNPKVIVNPYEISPLTAIIIFTTIEEVEIILKINDEKSVSFDATKEHIIPVYGLIPNYQNQITITGNNIEQKIEIKTKAVPERYKNMEVVKKSTEISNDLYLITSPMGDAAAAYDNNGNIRWYLTENYYFTPRLLSNGHLILGNGEIRDKYGSSTGFIEIDLLGKIYNYYRLPNGYHHHLIELENSYIFASNNLKYNRFFDNIIELSKEGEIINEWDLFTIIQKIDSDFAKDLDEIWAWINSVYYNKASNSLIISLRGRNSVISIDYTTSKLNWILGDKKYWSEKFNSYILEADANTRLPLGQHSAFITSEGYLGLFNNNYDASSFDKTISCDELFKNVSSTNLYKINKKQITQIWTYSNNFFSYALSNFQILENKHKLILSGWEFKHQNNCQDTNDLPIQAHLIELDAKDNIIFEGTISQGKFSAIKINLYNSNTKKINLSEAKIYNQINQEQKSTKNIDFNTVSKTNINYSATTNRFEINGLFPLDSEIRIIFVNENNTSIEYLIKEKNSQIMYPLLLNNMNGKYHLFLIENNTYFDTELILEF